VKTVLTGGEHHDRERSRNRHYRRLPATGHAQRFEPGDKCAPFLREDAQGPGVIAIKQDISSLYGLDDGFFDYVVLNNVLYSLEPEG
jgi:hypothetical protein